MTTYKSLLREVRGIKKLANDKYREKLLTLLESEDSSFINQGLELNEQLGILTDDEVVDAVYDGDWEKEITWVLLRTYPNAKKWKLVKELWLEGKNLKVLPSEIQNLTNLEYLWLGMNYLSSLPSWIGNLTNLEYISLGGNKYFTLPEEMVNLKKVRQFLIFDSWVKWDGIPEGIQPRVLLT